MSQSLSIQPSSLSGLAFVKRSIDARGKQPYVIVTVNAFINEPFHPSIPGKLRLHNVSANSKKVLIAGAGPAGLFAALKFLEVGIKPVIIERGKDVRARRRDLAILNKEGILNPESNYCFGEGGAGT